MALTATATPRVQADVILQLHLKQCEVFKSSFNRPNLRCIWDLGACGSSGWGWGGSGLGE
jgi:hypothetical protein